MNYFCPECRSTMRASPGASILTCSQCGFTVDPSALGTYPGGAFTPIHQDLSGEAVFELAPENASSTAAM